MPMDRELERLRLLAAQDGFHVLRAIDANGKTAAAGLFQESPVSSEEIYFIHGYVRPEYRGQDITQSFFQYAEQYFSALGVDHLRVRCWGDEAKLESFYDYLVKETFVPLITQGAILAYRLSSWFQSAFAGKIGLMEKYMANVLTLDHWEDPRLQAYLAAGGTVPRDCFDPRFCRFYAVDGQIRAALCARQPDEEVLFFYDLHFTQDCPRQAAFIAMLASFLQQARQSMSEDAILVVKSDLISIQSGLREQFGKAEEEYLAQEYLYRFGRRLFAAGTPEELSGWQFEAVEPAQGDFDPDLLLTLPFYQGLDEGVLLCLRDSAGMTPGSLDTQRQTMTRDEDVRAWRKELDLWQERLGRSPFGMDKPLPFEAFLALTPSTGSVVLAAGQQPLDVTPEELEYSCYIQGAQIFAPCLPSHLRQRCAQGELIVLAGRTKDEIVLSYAVFSPQNSPRNTMFLEYIFVSPAQRRLGFGSKLLDYAHESFTAVGVRGITAKQAQPPQQAQILHSFLTNFGFSPVSMDTTMVSYYLQSLHDTTLLTMPQSQIDKLPRTQTITDRNDMRLKQLVYDNRGQDFFLDRLRYDPRFTFFHEKDGVIRAVASMKQLSENTLVYHGMWFAPGYDTPYLRAALLRSLLDAAVKYMRDDTVVVFQFDPSWKLETVHSLLGQDCISLSLFEYVLPGSL